MFKEGALDTRTSVLIGGVLATSVFLANPSVYKIGTTLPNFHFSTTASHESAVTVQLGPSTLQISVPAPHVSQSQVASVALPADGPIIYDPASASITMATPQLIETTIVGASMQSASDVAPISASVATPAISETIAPAVPETPVPAISVPVPIESVQVQAPVQESATPSVPADTVIENTAVESAVSAPAAAEPVVTPVAESVQEVETPAVTTPVEEIPTASETPVEAPAAIPVLPVEECHPSYIPCLRIDASDYDCEGGTGNGPYYTGKVQVIGPDVFGLDKNGDGWGCEAS